MATIKSFSDLKQSKKLAEILPLESADMFLAMSGTLPVMSKYIDDGLVTADESAIPCWSLASLRNLLPPAIKPNKDSCLFLFESHNTFDKSWVYRYYNEDDTSYLYYKNTNEVDACVAMIEKLNELNLL